MIKKKFKKNLINRLKQLIQKLDWEKWDKGLSKEYICNTTKSLLEEMINEINIDNGLEWSFMKL